MNFALAVLSSVIGGVLLLGLAGLLSERARWVLTSALSRLLDIDVEYVFRSPRAAAKDVEEELRRARSVHLLTGRGNELQREAFAPLLGRGRRSAEVCVLLPCTDHEPAYIDWVDDREAELSQFDQAFGTGTLRGQIRANAAYLAALPTVVEVRRYDFPHIGRILVTDRCAYLTPYADDAHGRDSRVIKYRRSGEMYDFLDRIFTKSWLAGHDEKSGPPRGGPPPAEPGSVAPAG